MLFVACVVSCTNISGTKEKSSLLQLTRHNMVPKDKMLGSYNRQNVTILKFLFKELY